MKQLVIDRFEGDIAVCEQIDRTMFNIQRSKLPPAAKEGDVILIEGDTIRIDPKATAERASQVGKMMQNLWRKEKP